MTYHPGERWVQEQVGVREEADGLAKIIRSSLEPKAQKFLQEQFFAIAATVDSQGWVWASLLLGKSGFIQGIGKREIQIPVEAVRDDLLCQNLNTCEDLGLLVINFANRRRLRLNGKAQVNHHKIELITEQVYFNCPKYIQKRQLVIEITNHSPKPTIQEWQTLPLEWQKQIAKADTFFIASWHPNGGADASHRGGNPGFIQVLSDNVLTFLDYMGNNLFNTLGNLVDYPQCGLFFLQFEENSALQLTGTATILWQTIEESSQRLVTFHIHRIRELSFTQKLHWQFLEYSPFNPR